MKGQIKQNELKVYIFMIYKVKYIKVQTLITYLYKILVLISCVIFIMSIKKRKTSYKQLKINTITQDKLEKPKINEKIFEIFYNQEQVLTLQLQTTKTVGDLLKTVKHKLKDRFYNILGLQSYEGLQVLDAILLDKNHSLQSINNHQKFKILLEGQVADLQKPTLNDFTFLKCLGKGATSIVYLVRHNQNCNLYALKQIHKKQVSSFGRMESVLRQKKILIEKTKNSKLCSKLYAAFQSKNHLNFLLQYYPGGEMFIHLKQQTFNENQIKLYFCQIVLAIESLHQQKVIFRDLKPENIMIDLYGNAILSDFGLCKINLQQHELTDTFCGSDIYMPPQIKNKIPYNYHVDFYALGALLYEMTTGLPPSHNQKPLSFPLKTSKQLISLALRLLQPNLTKRLCDFTLIKNHIWLQDIDWQKLSKKQLEMPIKLNPYKKYIHEQFQSVQVHRQIKQGLFDRLFDSFLYISPSLKGISKCYLKVQNNKNRIQSNQNVKKNTSRRVSKSKSQSKYSKSSAEKAIKPIFNKTYKVSDKIQKSCSKQKNPKKNKVLNSKSLQNSPNLYSMGQKKLKKKVQLRKKQIDNKNINSKTQTKQYFQQDDKNTVKKIPNKVNIYIDKNEMKQKSHSKLIKFNSVKSISTKRDKF